MSHMYFVNHSLKGSEWFDHPRSGGYRKVCTAKNKRERQRYCERELMPMRLGLPDYGAKQ